MSEVDRQALYSGTEVAPPHLALNTDALWSFLQGRIPLGREFSVEKFKGGQSNPTYKLSSSEGDYVLRRRPPGDLVSSAHQIDREFKVISALDRVAFPVPRPFLFCEERDVIGSDFYIVGYNPGRVFWNADAPGLAREERAAIYDNLNTLLARIHRLDYKSLGLGDFGRTGDYTARNLARWTKIYQTSKLIDIPDMEWLAAALLERLPKAEQTTLLHGDYALYNVIVNPNAPRIDAVLDWELSTLGNPLIDLVHNLRAWWDIPDPVGGATSSLRGRALAELGIPTMDDYIQSYCARVGLKEMPDRSFYLGFAQYRYAAMIQGILKRAADGTNSNARVTQTQDRVVAVAAMARSTVEGTEDGA